MYKLLLTLLTISLLHPISAMEPEQPLPLFMATASGNTAEVEQLLALGANPNATDSEGSYVLCKAVYYGHKDICQALLKAGADVNARNKTGNSAIIFAAAKGYTEIGELLLAHGAEVNTKGEHKKTPLLWAANRKHLETCELLLAHGADAFTQETDSASFMTLAASREGDWRKMGRTHLEHLGTLLISQNGDLNKPIDGTGTLLHYAATWSCENLCNRLIAAGADVNIQSQRYKDTPLSRTGYLSSSDRLDKNGRAINSRIGIALINAGARIPFLYLFSLIRREASAFKHVILSPDLSTLANCQKNILHLLCCLRMAPLPQLPKEVQYLILAFSHPQDTGNLMIARRIQGKSMLNQFASTTALALYNATIEQLKKSIASVESAYKESDGPSLVTANTFEAVFGKQIEENIRARLAQPKLLCNEFPLDTHSKQNNGTKPSCLLPDSYTKTRRRANTL